MKIFKNYFKIVKYHKTAIIIYSAIFLALLTFSTKADTQEIYSSINVDIYVEDNANTELSKALYSYLQKNANIVEMEKEMADDNLFYEMISAIVEIPEDFDETREVNYKSAPKDIYGMAIKEKINQFLNQVASYEAANFSKSDAIKFSVEDLNKKANVKLENKDFKNSQDDSNFYFNLLNYMIMAQVILIVSTIMTVYKKETISKRNLISPISKKRQNFELILGHIVTGICIWFLYMLLFFILWRDAFGNYHVNLMMLNSLVFTICVVSMAILISKIIKNEESIQGVLNIVALGSSFLSGSFVPQEMLGDTALKIARILPSYYYIKNNNMVVNNPELSTILPNIWVMLLFTLGFSLIYIFSKEKESA